MISVSARGNPNTTEYTWTRDGLPIVSSNRRVTAHGSTLNITKLDRHDAGTYICEALNKEGTTFYQLNLTVQCEYTFATMKLLIHDKITIQSRFTIINFRLTTLNII